MAGVKDPELKAGAVAEGFHFSAEGPGGATWGRGQGHVTRAVGLREGPRA